MRDVDLCVIGSGPGGQRAAIASAKAGKSVAIIERMEVVGGVAINTGTIPSKALREAVIALASARQILSRNDDSLTPENELEQLISQCHRVIRSEVDLVRSQLVSNGVEILIGTGSLVDANTVRVDGKKGVSTIKAKNIVLATGTTPARPSNINFDQKTIITSDEILKLPRLPRSMIVVGGGVIGTEYASMMAALGVRVTIIEGRPRLLDFVDQEVTEALQYHLRQMGATLRLGEKVVSIRTVEPPADSRSDGLLAEAVLESGKTLRAECLMYCIGRQGATSSLNLAAAGLATDNRGRIEVNRTNFQTKVPSIYAVGDVIGFPALASTSMEQGRIAALSILGRKIEQVDDLLPYGIYSIPEISMIGWTEERLTAEGIPYEAGIAQYKEIARGQLLGDTTGMLKLLIHQDSRTILGAHCIGTNATELIHIAQAVMTFKGTVDYFVNTVFNYPTLAECYKVAAYNGMNKLRSV